MWIRAAALILLTAVPAAAAHRNERKSAQAATHIAASARDLFTRSDLTSARAHAEQALLIRPHDPDALFLLMEAATLQADTTAELHAAVRLCELNAGVNDPRAQVGASHVLDLAANTASFRQVIARIQQLLTRRNECESTLRAALISAVMDGAPGASPTELVRNSGLLTEWRVAGPFGKYSNVEFEQAFPPETVGLRSPKSGDRPVEAISSLDGTFQLPEYFEREGVYYAEAEFSVSRRSTRILRVESPGTLRVWIDGFPLLTKDDRFRVTPEVVSSRDSLRPGKHRLLVKFIPSALPFRVATLPDLRKLPALNGTAARSEIVSFAGVEQKYWKGDYNTAIAGLSQLQRKQPSALIDYLLARSWHQQQDGSPEEDLYLNSAAEASHDAAAVSYLIAHRAYSAGRLDDAIRQLRGALIQQPQYVPAQELSARIASENRWTVEAANAFAALENLHPSCDNLHRAHNFYLAQYDFPGAKRIESRLDSCGPAALDLVEVLSATGKHQQAVAAAQGVIQQYPLERDPRLALIRELAHSGQLLTAHKTAEELHNIAPNSSLARYLSSLSLTDLEGFFALNNGGQTEAFAASFYLPLSEDGLDVVRQAATSQFSPGPAQRLLDQRIVHLNADNGLSVYTHRVTRIGNRSGIQQYGEVLIPSEASLLELRTIQPDGTIAEPELEPHKQSISMPALVPGSSIDIEYVAHFLPGDLLQNPDEFAFAFGSFQMPVLRSSFAFIAGPRNDSIRGIALAGAPSSTISEINGERVELWKMTDLPQAKQQSAAPPNSSLPIVSLVSSPAATWSGIQSTYRNSLIDATRIGAHVEHIANSFPQASEEARARAIYHYVQDKVKSDGSWFDSGDVTNAEDTLAEHSGNATVAMIALARACGIQADLVLARGIAVNTVKFPALGTYDHPLIQLRLHAGPGNVRSVLIDVEENALPFGTISAEINLSDALFVPLERPVSSVGPIIALLPDNLNPETIAHGDIAIEDNGDLRAEISVKFSDWRSSQLRVNLDKDGKKELLGRVAREFFKDATDIGGLANNLDDQPLSAQVRFRVPHFWNFQYDQGEELTRLLPALGLKNKYASSPSRHFTLYVDSPEADSTTFRVHFPEGIHISEVPAASTLRTKFGIFELRLQPIAGGLEISRKSAIPIQLIEPRDYSDFVDFTEQINNAERARLRFASPSLTAATRN